MPGLESHIGQEEPAPWTTDAEAAPQAAEEGVALHRGLAGEDADLYAVARGSSLRQPGMVLSE